MDIEQAREAIEKILASIPDKNLPAFDKVEVSEDGTTVVWTGSVGHHLGGAKRDGKREPLVHRSRASLEAIESEMVHRADARYLANGDKPHGIKLAKRTVLR